MPTPVRLGRYEILEPLGQGAMGIVYKARDPVIDRLVAVKTLAAALLASPARREEFLARFRRESRAAGRLSHPRIVSVFDAGIDEETGTPYIVMEYVQGVSLAVVLHENATLPVDQALDILEQAGSALDEAHGHGVIHRDVKPGNVFLDTRGRVKVGDFGIARLADHDATHTSLGTPGYLAPELLRGAPADARSDLYALAVVAYHLLTGSKPGQTPPPPHAVRPDVPQGVSEAVMRALESRPEDRTPNVAWFLAELKAGREAGATSGTSRPGASRQRRRLGVLLLAAAVLAGAAGFLVFARPRRVEPVSPADSKGPRATPAAGPSFPTSPSRPSPSARPHDDRDPQAGRERGRERKKPKTRKKDR